MQNHPRFILFHIGILFISFGLLQTVIPVGGDLDLSLIHPWISESGQFLLRDNWYLAKLNHKYVKDLLIAVYVIMFFAWIASFKVERLKPRRTELGYFFWVSMLCTIVVSILKSQSSHACPWMMTIPDTDGFFWDFSAMSGHCFPGGHASLGFSFITGYFLYHITQPKRAYFYLVAGLVLGMSMGWAQMMRGAHFMSHNLWTLWICSCINIMCYVIFYLCKKQSVFLEQHKTQVVL